MRRTAPDHLGLSCAIGWRPPWEQWAAGFPDVPDDHVHANGIQWAAENGLMVGYNNGTSDLKTRFFVANWRPSSFATTTRSTTRAAAAEPRTSWAEG